MTEQVQMLNEEAAQEEQRRNQRVEIIREIADLERERDKTTNKLRRASRQTLTRFNFGVLEDLFLRTTHFNSRLISRINDWEDLLDTDQDGNPQYPPLGMPESRYSPEGQDFSRKTSPMEEVLSATQEILIRFLISLYPPEQIILSQEAQSAFLKYPEALIAHYRVLSQDDDEDQEEVTNIVIPPPVDNAVIPPHVDNPEDALEGEENAQAQDKVRSQPLSS